MASWGSILKSLQGRQTGSKTAAVAEQKDDHSCNVSRCLPALPESWGWKGPGKIRQNLALDFIEARVIGEAGMELIYIGGQVQGCCSWSDTWRHYWQVMENRNPFRWPCALSGCIFLTAFWFHLNCLFFKFIHLQEVITSVLSDKGVLCRHAETDKEQNALYSWRSACRSRTLQQKHGAQSL